MSKGVILIDFDNVFYGRDFNTGVIKSQLDDFIQASLAASPQIDYLTIRFYGGWKMNAAYTAEASKVLGCIESVQSDLFPYIYAGHRVYGEVELATSQYNVGIEWENTLQEKRTRHKLNVKTDTVRHCHHEPEKCPIHLVAKATRGHKVSCPIDGCETLDISQLVRLEQKMVDSMMNCDILEYILDKDSEVQVLEVVSDDIDFHPALALAGERYAEQNGVKLLLMVNNKQNSELYEQQLGAHHIQVQTWQ